MSTSRPSSSDDDGGGKSWFSDHIATVNAFNKWQSILQRRGPGAAAAFCSDSFLSHKALQDIQALRDNFRDYLRGAGFLHDAPRSGNSGSSGADEGGGGGGGGGIKKASDQSSKAVGKEGGDESEMTDVSTTSSSSSSSWVALVTCALCAGLYPQVVRLGRFADPSMFKGKGKLPRSGSQQDLPIRMLQSDGKEVALHPCCLLYG